MLSLWYENAFCIIGPWWWVITNHWWIPLTKGHALWGFFCCWWLENLLNKQPSCQRRRSFCRPLDFAVMKYQDHTGGAHEQLADITLYHYIFTLHIGPCMDYKGNICTTTYGLVCFLPIRHNLLHSILYHKAKCPPRKNSAIQPVRYFYPW